ncbi:MAG: hypothetical protein ACTTHL_01130 [Oribacterium sp.]
MSQNDKFSNENQLLDSYYNQFKNLSDSYNKSKIEPFEEVSWKDVTNASSKAQDYNAIEKRERTAKAHRHELINGLIEDLKEPLRIEQKNKNSYRRIVLLVYGLFFLGITIATFVLLFCFMIEGFNKYTTQVAGMMISGLFVNIIGLAIIIFKYLFDDKNSLLKDMILLVVKTLQSNDKQNKE